MLFPVNIIIFLTFKFNLQDFNQIILTQNLNPI
jgi:hypothetical protein